MPRLGRAVTLENLYTLPDSANERFFHTDLPNAHLPQLRLELEQLRLRLLIDPQPHWWLLERFARLTEVLDGSDSR